MLCDKHVVKMSLETAQILSTAIQEKHDCNYSCLYKSTHKKHLCVLWAGESLENWLWLIKHGLEICKEYTIRYGKIHKSQKVIERCSLMQFCSHIGHASLTPFAQAMPEEYKNKDVVTAYRNYYVGEKSYFAKWKTQQPSWWTINE